MNKVCSITLSWGDAPYYFHGLANNALAKRTKRFNEQYRLPAIAQWEIAENLLAKQFAMECISIPLPEGKDYMDTYYVLKEAKREMDERGYTHAVLIAHEVHLPRVRLVAKQLGIIESRSFPRIVYDEIPYDSNSRHLQATSEYIARPYELFAILWYWVTGKI